jgi:protein-tyrosine phosphatase
MQADHRDRLIPLEGGVNFRDLGGYLGAAGRTIRWRYLFRSGTIHSPTEEDLRRLAELGIRGAIDLRSNQERRERPHALSAQTEVSYVAYDHDQGGGDLLRLLDARDLSTARLRGAMLALYRTLPYDLSDVYRRFFRSIASGPLPLVFNCAAGKDRTGIAAALLLSALKVSWNQILADYELTEGSLSDIMRMVRPSRTGQLLARLDRDTVAPLFSADPAYLEAMRESIVARSGSMDEYLLSTLQMDAAELAALQARLLA